MYIEHAPWSAGKAAAYVAFQKYVGWRPYSGIVRTRYGDLMDITLPDLLPEVICGTGNWEPAITHHILANLAAGDIFVDAGANFGWYTLLASRIVGPHGKVVAIEASPSIYRALIRNLELNRCRNVTALNAAAAGEAGELPMYYNSIGSSGRSTTVEEFARANNMQLEANVRADTLEHLVGRDVLRNARFIKIDVEGAERTVLEPLSESLQDFSEHTEWMLELIPIAREGAQADVDFIYEAFVKAGYACYLIPGGYRPENFVQEGKRIALQRLRAAPRVQCDVLMTRRQLTAT
jgi:FkbM family methyltransferase